MVLWSQLNCFYLCLSQAVGIHIASALGVQVELCGRIQGLTYFQIQDLFLDLCFKAGVRETTVP